MVYSVHVERLGFVRSRHSMAVGVHMRHSHAWNFLWWCICGYRTHPINMQFQCTRIQIVNIPIMHTLNWLPIWSHNAIKCDSAVAARFHAEKRENWRYDLHIHNCFPYSKAQHPLKTWNTSWYLSSIHTAESKSRSDHRDDWWSSWQILVFVRYKSAVNVRN